MTYKFYSVDVSGPHRNGDHQPPAGECPNGPMREELITIFEILGETDDVLSSS